MNLHTEMGALAECPAQASAFLPDQWRRPNAGDAARLDALIRVSRRFRDRDLAAALLSTVRDSTRSMAERDAALIVLAAYLDPSFSGSATQGQGGDISVGIGSRLQAYQEDGARPLRLAELDAIFQVIDGFAKLKRTVHTGDMPSVAKIVVEGLQDSCRDPQQRTRIRYCPPPKP